MPIIDTIAGHWAADLALRATLILALACVIAGLLRRTSAALRHLAWTAAVVALLALPLLVVGLPAWRALPRWQSAAPARVAASQLPAMPPPAMESGAVAETLSPVGSPAEARGDAAAATPGPASMPAVLPSQQAHPSGWLRVVLIGWLAGIALCLAPLAVALVALLRLCTRARPCRAAVAQGLLDECRRELGLGCRVLLVEAPGVTPMTFGMIRPRILVPVESADWSVARWRIVLRHELAHIQRRDLLTQMLAQTMRAIYWFHPLAWFVCARMAAERERACDDLAVSHGGGMTPAAYAEELFAVARSAGAGRQPSRALRLVAAAVVPMARFSTLESRVRAVLDGKRSRRRLTGTLLLATVLAGVAIVLPVATLRAAAPRADASAPPPAPGAPPAAVDPANIPTVAVLGEVRGTGVYQLTPGTAKVGEMLAQAGLSNPDMTQTVSLYRRNLEGGAELIWTKPLLEVMGVALLDKDLLVVGRANAPASAPAPVAARAVVDPALIAIQEAEVEIARHNADDVTEIEAEKAVLAQSQADLARMEAAKVSSSELDRARLDVTIGQARIKIAESRHEQALLLLKQAQAKLQAVKNGVPPAAIRNASDAIGHSDGEDQAILALAKHAADDTTEIDAEQVILKQSEADYARIKAAHDSGTMSQAELDRAAGDFAIARSRVAIATSRREEQVLKYKLLLQQVQARQAKAGAPAAAMGEPAKGRIIYSVVFAIAGGAEETREFPTRESRDDFVKELEKRGGVSHLAVADLQAPPMGVTPGTGLPILPADIELAPGAAGEFYILGVPRPGVYSLNVGKVTVKQALAAAGMDPEKLAGTKVTLTRRKENAESTTSINAVALFAGSEPDRYLQPNDLLKVESAASPATAPH